jgi:hypothetical protein
VCIFVELLVLTPEPPTVMPSVETVGVAPKLELSVASVFGLYIPGNEPCALLVNESPEPIDKIGVVKGTHGLEGKGFLAVVSASI